MNGLPATTGLGVGWPVTTNWLAAAATTPNDVPLVTAGKPPPDAPRLKPLPTLVNVNPLNVAMPFDGLHRAQRTVPPGCRVSVTLFAVSRVDVAVGILGRDDDVECVARRDVPGGAGS